MAPYFGGNEPLTAGSQWILRMVFAKRESFPKWPNFQVAE
jgi:hypothetical protein